MCPGPCVSDIADDENPQYPDHPDIDDRSCVYESPFADWTQTALGDRRNTSQTTGIPAMSMWRKTSDLSRRCSKTANQNS